MINKNVALITGAAGSIGKELCKKFSEKNYSIAAFDIKGTEVISLHKELQIDERHFLGLNVDVTNYEEVHENISYIRDKLGKVNVLINNAGGPMSDSLAKTTKKEWLADIELNLNAAYYVISAIVPHMIENGGGSIINIGSVNGIHIYGHPGYSAAKAGLIQLTKFLAVEFGRHGIRSNIICPGTVKTEAWKKRLEKNSNLFEHLKEIYSTNDIVYPADIAKLAIFLASSDARMINGSTIVMDGGLTAGIPSIAQKFIQTEF